MNGLESGGRYSCMTPLPLTRREALASWKAFLPRVKEYAARRNHVEAGHENVSRLSPALRHRLLTEDELIRDTLEQHSFRAAEKWLQEVCSRRYWKGWLELRSQVWTSWTATGPRAAPDLVAGGFGKIERRGCREKWRRLHGRLGA